MLSSSKNPPWKALSAFLIKSKLFLYGAAFTLIGRTAVSRIYSRIQPQKAMLHHIRQIRSYFIQQAADKQIEPGSVSYREIMSAISSVEEAALNGSIHASTDFQRIVAQLRQELSSTLPADARSEVDRALERILSEADLPTASDRDIHRAPAVVQP